MAALRQSRDQQAPPCQSLWQGGGGLAADVGAASRYPSHRRSAFAAVRPLRRLLEQISEARVAVGFIQIGQASQYQTAAVGGARQLRPHGIPDRTSPSVGEPPVSRA